MEQRLRAFHPEILKVGNRRFAEHRFAAALQGACARRQRVGSLLQRKPFPKMLARLSFETLNQRIGLRQMVGDDEGSLQGAQIGQQVARNDGGQFRASLADKPESMSATRRCSIRNVFVSTRQNWI